jgi:hypothetical protein
MSTLSPAAQAVLDAFAADNYGVYLDGDPDRLAAALRAAADQVVPEEGFHDFSQGDSLISLAKRDERSRLRWEFLAIAAELEADR